MHRLARYGMSALLVIALGCNDDDDDDTTTVRDPSTVGDAGADAGNGNDDQGDLSDAQIGGVVMTANIGEVEQGLVALTLARRQEVRDFATQMADEHSDAQKRQASLLQTLGVRPRTSGTSERLRNTSERIVRDLLKENPSRFDLTYMRAQVSVHQQVLSLIDQRLLTSADNPALRVELSNARTAVASHLQTATALRDTLAAQADAGAGGGGTTAGSTAGTTGGATGGTGGTTAGTGGGTTAGTNGGGTGVGNGGATGIGTTGIF